MQSHIAQHLTQSYTIGRKLELIKGVCEILGNVYGLERTELYSALLKQIATTQSLVGERNSVIHGNLTHKRGQRPVVQLKKQSPVELSPAALSRLTRKIDSVTESLIDSWDSFMGAVDSARKKASKPKPIKR